MTTLIPITIDSPEIRENILVEILTAMPEHEARSLLEVPGIRDTLEAFYHSEIEDIIREQRHEAQQQREAEHGD